MAIHERLYALVATFEPDAAEELTACADAAKDMLAALNEAASVLPVAARLHPKDLAAIQSALVAALAKARAA